MNETDHTLEQVLRAKQERSARGAVTGLVTARTSDTVSRVVDVLNARAVGAVLVTEGDQLVGIFTERDVLRRVLGPGHDPWVLRVASVMTSQLSCADPAMKVSTAMRMMSEAQHRHLPVVERGLVVGIVSIGDLTHHVSAHLRESVSDLSTYIGGPAVSVGLPYAARATTVSTDTSANSDAPYYEGPLRFTHQ